MNKREEQIKEYFQRKKKVYTALLDFIESTEDLEIEFYNLTQILTGLKSKEEIIHFLELLISISNNHYRDSNFFIKIERILQYLDETIKQTLTNEELFNILKSNKRILLFAIGSGMIIIGETEANYLYSIGTSKTPSHRHFFIYEIQKNISKEKTEEIKNEINDFNENNLNDYQEKRLLGENDSYICSLIRTDSIDEFISHVTRTSFSLKSKIKPSIFETNTFLIDKNPTLIEYSAFYGSIQIFNFLRFNNVELEPSLWLYSIHSNKPEMIHLLEEQEIYPDDETYEECLEESIKSHHNGISNYIKDNLMTISNSIENRNQEEKYIEYQHNIYERIISYAFKYCNYFHFPTEFNQNFIFYYLSKYHYLKIVKIFIKNKRRDIKMMRIIKIYNFLIKLKPFYFTSSLFLNHKFNFKQHNLWHFEKSY